MADATPTQFRREGEPAFPMNTEKEDSAAPSAVETKETDTSTASSDGGQDKKTQTDTAPKVPFHEDPQVQDYISRQVANRIDDFKKSSDAEIAKIRAEIANKREENANTEIPEWFGGDEKAWTAYKAHEDAKLKALGEQIISKLKSEEEQGNKQVKEAEDYFVSEVAKIEADKTLNPSGEKIDRNKLLKFVLDEKLVDTEGRWNYRAAFRMMKAMETTAVKPKDTTARKGFAAATTTGSERSPSGSKDVSTSEDFKVNRPW